MPDKTDFINTPRYLLKSGNQPIFPTINFENPDANCVCFYGFSDKTIYDMFIKNTDQKLTPYPIVKGYLSMQMDEVAAIEAEGDLVTLVILDAIHHSQPVLSAATMTTVLLAYQEKAVQVKVDADLTFDPNTVSYRFKKRDSESMLPI